MNVDGHVSAWSVWLHPRRAARRLDEVDAMAEEIREKDSLIESLRSELAVGRDTISLLDTEVHTLKQTEVDFRAKYNALNNQLHIAQEKIGELQADLDSHVAFDEAIANMESQLQQVEQMKKTYENRITLLNLKVEEAQRRLRQAGLRSDLLADPRPIRLDAPADTPTSPKNTATSSPASQPSQSSQSPRKFKPSKKQSDSTSWLRDIPENI